MNALRHVALKTIVKIAYEIAIGKRGTSDTNDNQNKNKKKQDDN